MARRFSLRWSSAHVTVLIIGVLAAALNFLLLSSRGVSFPVAVLDRDVAAGSPIDLDDLRFESVQAGPAFVEGLVERDEVDALAGLVTTRPMTAGQVLAETDLRPVGAPSDLRAFAIPVPPERAVGGALAVNDRVDVLVAEDGTAAYLATGLQVLDVVGGEGGIGISSFSVTVAADAETVLRLAAALESGTVSIVRSTGADAPTLWELPAVVEGEDG